jgi:hypothetical protein
LLLTHILPRITEGSEVKALKVCECITLRLCLGIALPILQN